MADDDFLEPNLPSSPFGVVWHAPGLRTFHAGVDRGMLYLNYKPGIPWPGLISVNEKPTGGEIRPFYIDGIRRRNDHKLEEFSASITAFLAPIEFSECVGELELVPGLYLGQQTRASFGFSYRTLIGSDTLVLGDHYEINIVYQAMAEPSSRTLNTLAQSTEADSRSWDIETVPQDVVGSRPSARIRLDTRRIVRDRIREIEYILYGTELEPPRLPSIDEVVSILTRVDEVPSDDIPWVPPASGGA